ncbi:hypothetical protein [Citrobacter phage Tr1]|nr:hypothetical protein [Citrobacter phage Tr1]
MKTTGTNDEGVVVQSWDDLSNISDDKLLKLRDINKDHLQETFAEYMDARNHSMNIHLELSKRGVIKATV